MMTRTNTLRVYLLLFILLIALVFFVIGYLLPTHAQESQTEIIRDEYGVPHIFAPTLEKAAYAAGYAQAQDRLEELLKNYRKAEGTMSEAFGRDWFRHDYIQRIFRHSAISRERYNDVSPKMRACLEAFQEGVKQFMKEHPEQVPQWAPELHPSQIIALSRYIIWGWPLGQASTDLARGGITIDPIAYRGSNQMLLAPAKTSMKAPIAVIDPHLSWYDEFRFYEVRMYAGDFAVSGVSILGIPFPSLGHSQWASIAMTTGGPDTSDVFEEEVNPANPRKYKFDDEWIEMTVRKDVIKIRDGENIRQQAVEIESSQHGPIVSRRGGKAYAIAIPYMNEVGLVDQVFEMFTAHNLDEMKSALGKFQLMPQNIMIGTVQGDIFYVRNGRVPVRNKNCDTSKPLKGNSPTCDWLGLHPLSDLVQITNPYQGYMQNNNCSPAIMMHDSPMVPEKYPSYIFNVTDSVHQRALMSLEELHEAKNVNIEQAINLAYSTRIYKAEDWQIRLKDAWKKVDASLKTIGAERVYYQIINWNRRSDPDSTGALAFYAFKSGIGNKTYAEAFEVPANITDEELTVALENAASWLRSNFNSFEAPYGKYFRVGRNGGKTYPVGGGILKEVGMTTPRAIQYRKTGNEMVGYSGQTSTQVVILTPIPQSFSVIPLGESDIRESKHWDDQAEKLFSKGKMKSSFFMNRNELLKHVSDKKVF